MTTVGGNQALDEIGHGGDVFLCQLECDFDATMQAVKDEHERGMYTVVNHAPARALPDWVFEHIDLIVVNEGECETLTGVYPEDEASTRKAMEALAGGGRGNRCRDAGRARLDDSVARPPHIVGAAQSACG